MLTLFAVTERIAILGASRGIGRAIARGLEDRAELLLVSRRWEASGAGRSKKISLDLTREDHWSILENELATFRPSRIFYVAGGGPHGLFAEREFKDHLWAMNLNLLTPLRLLHWALRACVPQLIFFGSAVAEQKPDPLAASYASAKHGLLGLIESARAEGTGPTDLRLYSPGYTATDLLPPPAREKLPSRVLSPEEVAEDFIPWAFSNPVEGHRIFL
jgi:short-subunit dehydrogenase